MTTPAFVRNPDHWLYRLSAEEWMRAAVAEYDATLSTTHGGGHRTRVAGARRAAGMAINALLVLQCDERYGRTYMEHLVAMATSEAAPATVRAAASTLTGASLQGPSLVSLGGVASKAPPELLAAQAILVWVGDRIP